MFRTVPQGSPGAGSGQWGTAVWPSFTGILFGFLLEVYDPPAFQDPTTRKFKVAMKFLLLWASPEVSGPLNRVVFIPSTRCPLNV